MEDKKFIVKKDEKTDVITYMEYENLKGLNMKPKKNFEDMINVNEMIIINPSLIKTLINKKCKRKIEKLLTMLSIISEEDDDGEGYELILDEEDHFRTVLLNKYKDYIDPKELKIILKKLDLIKKETQNRKEYAIEKYLSSRKSNKGR